MTKKWLGSFLIFLLIVIVGISIGLSIYYFLRNNEVFSFGTGDEQSITQYANVGETFDIAVTRTNASSDEYSLQSLDESVAKFKEKFKDDESGNVEIWRFEALAGGNTTIQLITTNEAYKNLNVSIYVGNGTAEYPFYIRSYQDLSAISEDNASGMTLSAHYQQVADIDMSVANTAWNPIGTGSTSGFTGSYNGNNHVISNLELMQEGSVFADENTVYVDGTVENAGLFARVGNGGVVSRLTISNAIIDGNFVSAGAVAGVVNGGQISFVNVVDSVISSKYTTTPVIGGIAGKLVGTNYNARIQYSAVVNSTISAGTAGEIGGLVGEATGAYINNSYAIVSFATDSASNPIIGGIVGLLANGSGNTAASTSTKSAVVNNYSVLKELNIANTNNSRIGAIVGWNSNGGANTQAVLKPTLDEGEENVENRILGNFYQKVTGLNYEINGLGGFSDVSNAYLAYGQTAENMKKKPTQEQLDNIATSGVIDSSLAYVGYDIQGLFAGWNFDLVWNIEPAQNDGYPFIRADAVAIPDAIYDDFDVIYVSGAQALLNAFNADLLDDGIYNGKYRIDHDINLTELNSEWTPIGTAENPFNGEFVMVADESGNMPKIFNLVITTDRDYNGFFGVTGSNANIQNLYIEGVRITTGTYVGAIAALNGGSITDCTVRSNTDTDFTGIQVNVKDSSQYIGGVVGYNSNGAILQGSSAMLNVRIAGTENNHSINIGGIAGYSAANANITGCAYDGVMVNGQPSYTIEVNISAINSEVVAGGVVGNLYSRLSNSSFSGKLTAPSINGVIVGGVVGKYQTSTTTTQSIITACKATDINLTGYLAGGIIGKLDSTSNNGVTNVISQCYSTGSIYGGRIGGLAGEITRGGIVNSYTTCYLSGSVMGGFAADILFANTSDFGRVSYCFSNATFDKSAGSAYAETSSEVRALNNWWNADTKVGGYVEHCIYNGDNANGAERRYGSFRVLGWAPEPDDGKTSDGDCKRMETFTNRGFDSTIWNFTSNSYPTLNI